MNRLADWFEVKLDTSRSHGILRITGDIDTCSDVFRFLVHTLEQVRSVEITVSSEHLLSERISNQVERTWNELLLRQIEDNTSTVLIPSHRSPEPADIAKTVGLFPLADTTCHLSLLRVYYLGPQKDDLENVQRLLSQNFEASPLMRSFVIWERDRHFIRAKASPVEVGKGLPLVERGTQWSRWRTEIKKGVDDSYDDVEPKQHGDVLRTIASKTDPKQQHTVSTSAYQLLLDDIRFLNTLIVSPSYSNSFWEKHLIRETAAVFGQVIYPSASINKFRQEVTKGRSRFGGPTLQNQLQSRRSFYSNFPGMRWFLFSRPKPWFKGICLEESSREDLRIRLTPSQPKRMHEGKETIFPDLELRLTIDVEKKEAKLDSVRLIVDQGHVDLLLPEEITDVRFLTECYIPGGCQIDPQISNFVNAGNLSDLSVFKQDRLDTPATLRVSIPTYATRSRSTSASKIYNFNVDTGPDVPVEYTFANWAHRSYCTNIADKPELEFAVIKAGQTGGRRNEVRVVWQGHSRSIADFTRYFLHVRDLVDQFGQSINVDKKVLQIR